MQQYKDIISKILEHGEAAGDRTGTGTKRVFGHHAQFDCSISFPLVTLKYTHFPAIVHELLWFISGKTNIEYLQKNNVKIWDEWATDKGELGPVYGAQWRNANGTFRQKIQGEWVSNGIDQLKNCIDLIKDSPNSRRIILDSWNPKYLPDPTMSPKENAALGLMSLAPCHMFMQFYVSETKRLDMVMYQRSVDTFLGLPFNIASYALLLTMVAQVTGTTPGTFNWMGGDVHIYNNHREQIDLMMERRPLNPPWIELNPDITDIDDFTFEDIILRNYNAHAAIKGKISV